MTEDVVSAADLLRRYQLGERDFRRIEIEDAAGATPLRGASLEEANFSESFIVADFSSARLRGACFRGANVKTCCFDGADLRDADFTDAAIDAATFQNARVEGAKFAGAGAYGYAEKRKGPHLRALRRVELNGIEPSAS